MHLAWCNKKEMSCWQAEKTGIDSRNVRNYRIERSNCFLTENSKEIEESEQ